MKRACIAAAVTLLFVPVSAAPKGETLEAYAEWHKGRDLVVDGQRVTADNRTRFKGKFRTLEAISLGHEVTIQGRRLPDGRILAQQVEAKANGTALGEPQIRQATDEMEAKWMAAGKVLETDSEGKEQVIGRVVDSGNDFARAQRILARITPPYINPSSLRLHVVDTKDWNAMAMGNGSIWIVTRGRLGGNRPFAFARQRASSPARLADEAQRPSHFADMTNCLASASSGRPAGSARSHIFSSAS